ncbi:MAG TPA: hypothetical protein VGE77_13905 [Nocardioides sp.]
MSPARRVEVVLADDPAGPRAKRWAVAADGAALTDPPNPAGARLLARFDPYLQTWDRELVGTWRPRASGRRLRLATVSWTGEDLSQDAAVVEQAEALAGTRGQELAGFV